MRRYSTRHQRALANLADRIAKGTVTEQDLLALTASYEPRSDGSTRSADPEPEGGEKLVHFLCGVYVTKTWIPTPRNKHFLWEINWRGRYFSGTSWNEVRIKARSVFPRPPKRILGELVGFRGWKLRGEYLTSVTSNFIWEGPTVRIVNPSDFDERSVTGLYSVKPTLENIREVMSSYRPDAYGFVGVFGKVIEHENGYRSSDQVVRRIVLRLKASGGYVKLLADRYQCEVAIEKGFRE